MEMLCGGYVIVMKVKDIRLKVIPSKLANDLDTIPYEIMATLNRRIKRVYSNE